jgi:hypothetical protein
VAEKSKRTKKRVISWEDEEDAFIGTLKHSSDQESSALSTYESHIVASRLTQLDVAVAAPQQI